MRIIITGGTGLIGSALCQNLLVDNHEVIVLTRNPGKKDAVPNGVKLVQWDAKTAEGWTELADGADAIVNLAGEGIADSRWTPEQKKRIRESRLNAGQAVVEAVRAANPKPKMVIQASGIDYYGSRGDTLLTEQSPLGSEYLAQVCFDWEASTASVERLGVRRAVIRTGIVLSTEGGALPKILLPFKLFAGGPLGSGKQYWPWIHIDDEIRAIRFLIETENAAGAFNLTAPTPTENREFARQVGSAMGRPAFVPAPSPALKVGLGDMSQMLLDSHRAIPEHLQQLGFEFKYPTLDKALEDLLG